MLPKKYRLPIQTFRERRPKVLKGDHVTIKTGKSSLSYSRVGVVVSGKVSKKATRRNLLKRVVFRAARDFFIDGKGREICADVLVIVSPSADTITQKEFFAEISGMFHKII